MCSKLSYVNTTYKYNYLQFFLCDTDLDLYDSFTYSIYFLQSTPTDLSCISAAAITI